MEVSKISKKSIDEMMTEIGDRIQNDEYEGREQELYVKLHYFKKRLDNVSNILKKRVIDDFAKDTCNGKTEMGLLNATITYNPGSRYYDYSHIPEIQNIENRLKWFKDEAKNASLRNDQVAIFVDPNTGEQHEIKSAIVKFKAESITVKHVN